MGATAGLPSSVGRAAGHASSGTRTHPVIRRLTVHEVTNS